MVNQLLPWPLHEDESSLVRHEAVERDIPKAIRALIWERDRGQCQVCGGIDWLGIHHWLEWRSHGGGHEPENLVLICQEHHDAIHARKLDIVLHPDLKGIWRAYTTWNPRWKT